jgi:hypothetical protein
VSFNHTYKYIDNALSIKNHKFYNHVQLLYPYELEIKDTTEAEISTSYLDILLNVHSSGRMATLVNFPFQCNNILILSAYGMHISQLIQCYAY